MTDGDLSNDPEFKAWAAHVHAHVLPMIQQSALTISLVPRTETDIKFAVELGLSIMLDKPIIAVVQPGTIVAGKLRQVADHIVEADMTTPEGVLSAQHQLSGVLAAMGMTHDEDGEPIEE